MAVGTKPPQDMQALQGHPPGGRVGAHEPQPLDRGDAKMEDLPQRLLARAE